MLGAVELSQRCLTEVREPVDGRDAGTALQARRECLAQQACTGGLCDPRRGGQARPSGSVTADEDHRRLAGAQHLGDLGHQHRVGGRWLDRQLGRGSGPVGPGHVGGQDQGRDLRSRPAGGDRLCRVGGDVGAADRSVHPARDTAGERVDVGFQWRVVLLVVRGVVSDDDHHRDVGATGIVQVGQTIAQTGSQVQQYGGRPVGDARVAIGRPGGYAFEKT